MKRKTVLLTSLLALSFPLLSGCSSYEGTTLRVLNMEDYIYLYEGDFEEDEETPEDYKYDLTVQFERYIANTPELKAKYGDVKVIYDCTDTNETLYSELQTGKAKYDLICPSDYMIQKLIIGNYLEKIDRSLIPNYDEYASEAIKNRLDNIPAQYYDKESEQVVHTTLEDYAVGYMWGTLGILYNPEFSGFSDYAKENIHEDVKSWDILWDENYKGTISVKDSMRDTYAAGIIKAYEEELAEYRESHSEDEYRIKLEETFNRFDQDAVDAVHDKLNELKSNVFGLEVDSGKQDIITGKIGINLAWSGDAVYSMEQATEKGTTLYYAIPEEGSNIWFDGWCIPKRPTNEERTDKELALAHEFLNFLCSPEIAAENMEYIGYTTFIASDEVRDLVRDWYDARYDYMYFYEVNNDDEETGEELPVYYITMEENEEEELEEVINELCYEDFGSEHNHDYDDLPLYYDAYQFDDEGNRLTDEDGEELDPIRTPFLDPYAEDEIELTYGDITNAHMAEIEDLQVVELEYIFGGDEENYTFYSSYYFDGSEDEDNNWTGLDFFCQYPNFETANRCAVMRYDHVNNDRLVKMWEDFKSDALPLWAIILFGSEIFLILAGVTYVVGNKRLKKALRIKRLKEAE